MRGKSVRNVKLFGIMLCAILVILGMTVSVSASENTCSSSEVTQNSCEQNMLLAAEDSNEQDMLLVTEDSETLETVVDNDCVTFSSATRLQLATMSLEETWDGTMEYSTDKINWNLWDGGYINSAEAEDGNHYIYVRGDNNTVVSGGTTWALMKPDGDATISASGNIETLRGATGDQPAATPMGEDCYGAMFKDDQWLVSAPDLTATTLAENCYMQMFQSCISLTKAPALPAETLCESCYQYMFRGCNGLTAAPDLPATTLAESCYSHMFDSCYYLKYAPANLPAAVLMQRCYEYMFIDCIRLETTPVISATTLAENCCEGMFANCSVLKSAPELPVEELAKNCYFGMFTNCVELQNAPALPAEELAEGCYSEMFLSCQSLTAPADISHVTKLADYCCYRMYENCINIGVYKEAQPGYTKEWKATSTAASTDGWSTNMFFYTYGDFTDAPVAGATYYLADTTPIAHTAVAADSENGFVSLHQKYFIPGKTVEARAVPYNGYVAASFVARDANGSEIPIVNDAFTMPDSDVTVIATFKLDIQQCSVSGLSESYDYTGAAIEPAVMVKNGDTALTLNSDYTISYENNTNVGTATVTIKGIGDYAGTISETFTISKAIVTPVKTSDDNSVALYICMMLAALGLAFASIRMSKGRK